jgi:hypothetical protein
VNLLTLIALPRTSGIQYKSGLVFLLNLTVADLVYCLVATPTDAITYLCKLDWSSSTVAEYACSFAALTKYVAAFMDWTSLALIGIERYFTIVWNKRLQPRIALAIVLVQWIIHFSVFLARAKFGYNKWTKRCDMLPTEGLMDRDKAHVIWMGISTAIVTCCFIRIYIFVKRSASYLVSWAEKSRKCPSEKDEEVGETSFKKFSHNKSIANQGVETIACIIPEQQQSVLMKESTGNSEMNYESSMKRMLLKRELKLVQTIILTIGTYALLVIPMSVSNNVDYCVQHPDLRLGIYCFYTCIYFVNFFIYISRHRLYRKSCQDCLKKLYNCSTNREDK